MIATTPATWTNFFKNHSPHRMNHLTRFADEGGTEALMRLIRSFLPVLFFCQLVIAQQSVRTIYLIRHAEKASNDADAPLNAAGVKRAACLANMLKDAGIKQIYVTQAKRTQQTADPLAKELKITPKILPAEDPGNLVRDIFYSGSGNTLVVGHSNSLPVVIARMKAGTIAPIGENEYDKLFTITTMEGAATPVITLHYCEADAATAPASKPAHPTKATNQKASSQKSSTKK